MVVDALKTFTDGYQLIKNGYRWLLMHKRRLPIDIKRLPMVVDA
jgi:hypothetical protein